MPRFLLPAAAEAAGPRRVAEALRWLAKGEGRGLRSAGAQGETSPLDQSWREKSLTKPGGKPQSGSLSPTLVGCAGDGDCQSVRSGRRF